MKTHLLDLCKVVGGVLVQDELTEGTEGELGVWPNLCKVKYVVTELLGLLGSHRLLQLELVNPVY